MRRIISLFIFSTLLFVIISGSGFCADPINNTYPPINPNRSTNQKQIQSNFYTQETNDYLIQERDHYTSYDEIEIILKKVENDYKSIVKLYDDRGTTYEGKTIWMLKISDNPRDNEDDETEVLFVGAHHGDEAIGNEMALLIIDAFTDGYGKDPRITWLVDNHEIWVIPMPNPDGTEYTLNGDPWRKNRSPNHPSDSLPGQWGPDFVTTSYGTDLNRNYDMEWGDPEGSSILMQRSPTYAGSAPFSEFETQAIRALVLAHNFSVYMDYHSGTELILYPWGYTPDPTRDKSTFEQIGETFTELTGYETIQGYELYQTNGDSLDWIYSVSRTLAFTVELSRPKMPEPSTIQPILDNHIKLPLYLTGISSNPKIGSQIKIRHENIENQTDKGQYEITATINGLHELSDLDVKLYYRVNNNEYNIIGMKNSAEKPKQYTAAIPTQGPNSLIDYYIAVGNDEILVTSPDSYHQFTFVVFASEESIPKTDELVAMVIMMIIVLGFFWGGFIYTSRMAMLAEQRKLHEYRFGDEYDTTGRVKYSGSDFGVR